MYGYNEEYIDQVTMWETFLGQPIDFNKSYCSPFREDNNPKCKFSWVNDLLVFVDFGDPIKKHRTYHDLTIPLSFTDKKIIVPTYNFSHITSKKRNWTINDQLYWKQYDIKSSFLEKEFVHSNEWFRFFSKRKNKYFSRNIGFNELSYTLLVENYIKLYNPHIQELKWISNIPSSVIGGENDLPWIIDTLIIQKSLKDYIVCKYLYGLNTIWLQSEGVIPERLMTIINRSNIIVIMYDNDTAGVIASQKLKEFIETNNPSVKVFTHIMSKYKNVSDALEAKDKKYLNKFIKQIQNF